MHCMQQLQLGHGRRWGAVERTMKPHMRRCSAILRHIADSRTAMAAMGGPEQQHRGGVGAAAAAGKPVELQYTHYHTYEELTKTCQAMAAANSDTCRLSTLGQSREGREIVSAAARFHRIV